MPQNAVKLHDSYQALPFGIAPGVVLPVPVRLQAIGLLTECPLSFDVNIYGHETTQKLAVSLRYILSPSRLFSLILFFPFSCVYGKEIRGLSFMITYSALGVEK